MHISTLLDSPNVYTARFDSATGLVEHCGVATRRAPPTAGMIP
jgi:hypothetical protein